jgi:hypothetical protein
MRVKKMVRNFHELKGADEGKQETEELCGDAIKVNRGVFGLIFLVLVFFNVFCYEKIRFFLPVVYESQETYNWFSLVYFFHVCHCVVYINGVVSIELLPIISVLKLEGLVASLCRRMEEMTSGNLRENERKLDECIKFHVKVLK